MMAEFCAHELHGGVCKKTNAYCNLGACPYGEMREYDQVRKGSWIEKEDMVASYFADRVEVFYECDVCKEPNAIKSPYCHNCGAKMDGCADNG